METTITLIRRIRPPNNQSGGCDKNSGLVESGEILRKISGPSYNVKNIAPDIVTKVPNNFATLLELLMSIFSILFYVHKDQINKQIRTQGALITSPCQNPYTILL